ncbi:MSHA biogenesis protein MshN [Vibrio galatheae]|uniref:MSHA biogenesis protein MshN n=1 Tax=Vibrio galatheae TaxID=579748 RepID=A0A0F4NGS6_9VIBR|nr:tetratricopeptide repeat protein [Vibrio galatheae]KJY82043.1 MSHA biogenesis protein MshN [Vibrio galatheae]
MSVINHALSQLASEQTKLTGEISKADVKPIKQRAVLPWVVGSFSLSLAVGGWALSQQSPTELIHQSVPEKSAVTEAVSPTTKVAVIEQPIYHVVSEENIAHDVKIAKATSTPNQDFSSSPEPANVAEVAPAETQGMVVIEQVELTPQQLSLKAQESAKKALDSNNLSEALNLYAEALRYTPHNKQVRKRLAALYYGKGELRKAADILQKGIVLDNHDSTLRLSLARMLMKEQQNAVALTVLTALPESASVEYLSLRAALAQKEQQDNLALQSYQKLVQLEPQSGRWWMGLGISQEREFELTEAKHSYQQALGKLGLSSQSQQFIRDRIALISSLEEQPSEN